MRRSKGPAVRVRKAILPDAAAIHGLIFEYSRHGTLLARSLTELYENIRDFTVAEDSSGILGCGALHFYGMHLAEVRSIAVWPRLKGRGVGGLILDSLLKEAQEHHIACVCLFTRIPGFFGHLGFTEVKRERLPEKIYKDCLECGRREHCDEVAMVRGRLPRFSRLELAPQKHPRRNLSRI
jgi:amino-acid N-acetyltransferase